MQKTLNGLRGGAIVLVVLAHAGWGHIIPGGLGVMLFFVLSGFLLGQQLLHEQATHNQISWRDFYWRRFWRLAPALGLYVLLACAMLYSVQQPVMIPDILSVLWGYSNLYELYSGFSPNSPFPISWSLSLEIQFYLLLPLLLLYARHRHNQLIASALVCVAAITLWRTGVAYVCGGSNTLLGLCGIAPEFRVLKSTDTIMDMPLYGLLAAFIAYKKPDMMKSRHILSIGLCVLLGTLLYRDPFFRDSLRYTLQGIACGAIILHLSVTHYWPHRVISHIILEYLGKISYPLYLMHYGVLVFLHTHNGHAPPSHSGFDLTLYITLSLGLAIITHEYVEKRFIRLRRHYGSRA